MILSYKFRVYPNRVQADGLADMLMDFCELYNAALEHRIGAFRAGEPTTCYNQIKSLPEIRRDLPQHGRWSATAQQQVLRKLDKTFKAFFGRVKRGDKAGFPRFKSRFRYHAADFRVGDGLTLRKSGRLGIVGVSGDVKVKWHRALPNKPKSAILTRQNGKWFVVFYVEVKAAQARSGASVGIDMGLASLVALSNGETVARPNWTKQAKRSLRIHQRALARGKRGSKRRAKAKERLAVYQRGIANRRANILHKLSANLVSRFSHIAVEDLNIKGLARGMLAKEVSDAAWARLISMLDYKAAKAGGLLFKVDPRGTSQTCPECGIVKAKTLAERTHRCECGCALDRDVAAAIVIHARAFGHGTCLLTPSQRVAA